MFRSTLGTALLAAALLLPAGAAHADGVFQNGLPEGAARKLLWLVRHDAEVRCIAFTSTGGWVILYDDNGFIARGIPDDAFARLEALAEDGDTLKWIAFTPGDGYVILADRAGFWARDIPPAALLRLKIAGDDGAVFTSMTFVGKNGWVLVTDGGFVADGLPADLFRMLQKLSVNGDRIKSVAFTPKGGWAILVNRDGAWDSNVPASAMLQIDALQKLGGARFRCLAFPPSAEDAWVLLAD